MENEPQKNTGVDHINNLSFDRLRETLSRCCTSSTWLEAMVRASPFRDAQHLHHCADNSWLGLEEADYLEAFAGHPKIGDVSSLREKYAATRTLAANEQSGVDTADDTILSALAEENTAYEKKFGFIFIICATGKSAAQMLSILRTRLVLDRDTEIKNAIEQQRQIFQLRLEQIR